MKSQTNLRAGASLAVAVTALLVAAASQSNSQSIGNGSYTSGSAIATATPSAQPTGVATPTYSPETPFPSSNPTVAPANASLCVGGLSYVMSPSQGLDDEFQTDNVLYENPSPMPTAGFTSPPGGTQVSPPQFIWSTQLYNIGRTNNAGTDDAYYADAAQPGFGGYNPFSFVTGALQVQAEPVPTPYVTAPALSVDGTARHYLSGVLQSKPLTYGYVEVNAEEPNLQGFWPAPLWLIYSNGNVAPAPQIQEADVNELFGNALGTSVVQQTLIYHYAASPSPNSVYVRTTVSPNPQTNYHTYGVLWQAGQLTYYIDRVQSSPAYAAASSGAMNANIILQVFTQNTYAPGPATPSAQTVNLKYFRWYQATSTTCGTTVVATPSPTPTPTVAPPTASPAATNLAIIAQSSPDAVSTGLGNMVATLPTSVPTGTLLVGVASINGANPPVGTGGTNTGWNVLEGGSSSLTIFYGTVGGTGGIPSGTPPFNITNSSYGNGVMTHLIAVSGATQTPVIGSTSTDCATNPSSQTQSLTIPSAGGLTLTAAGGSQGGTNVINSISDTLPLYFTTPTVLDSSTNIAVGSTNLNYIRELLMTKEAYQANQPFPITETYSSAGYQPQQCVQIIYLR